MPNTKISDLTAKGASLAATDLIEISESNGQGGYNSKSVTGANVLSSKQDTLVSGTNIKTINSSTLLGAGDVAVQPTLVSGTNIKTVNNATLLGSGNIAVQNPITLTTTGSSGASTLIGTTLNIPQYSGATPSGISGAIQFTDGTNFSSDATNLFFDNTNDRLGVGQNVPTARVHIKGTGATTATTSLLVENSGGVASLQCTDDLSVFSHGKGATASNTVFGKGAFQGTATGAQSTIFGVDAGKVISGGNGNNLFGYQAGLSLGNGGNNVLVGNNAGVNIGIGSFNTFIGNSAGGGVISGSNNTFIGYNLTGTSAMAGTIMIGSGDTATGSNQCRFGSVGTNAGAVTAEVVAQANTWSVFINGVARKILLA